MNSDLRFTKIFKMAAHGYAEQKKDLGRTSE